MAARTTTDPQYFGSYSFRGITVVPHVGASAAKPRHVVVAPHLSSRQDFGAQNNNLPNLLRALNERVFNVSTPKGLAPTPQPERGVWRTLDSASKRIASRVREYGKVVPLSDDEFVEQCPANKRKLYTEAARELRQRGWSARDARIKAFVKFEKINFTKKKDPAPRIIQPRTPVYNIALGKFTRRIEHEMYKALAADWGDDPEEKVVMKGLTVDETASQLRHKWNEFHTPVAVGLDASRFDQHVSKPALQWEHDVYLRIFDRDPELAGLLKLQLRNKGYAFVDGHKLTYEVDGTRASGDMNTSLGNSLIMCTLVKEYIAELGIKAKFVNNGDDCVLFMEKRDVSKLDTLPQWFLRYGFEMEVELPVYEFEKVVFCQAQPVLVDAVNDQWVMVRQPIAAFGKDALSLAVDTELGYRQWSYAVGQGGGALYGDMPIFGSIYRAFERNGVTSNIRQSLTVSDSGMMRFCRSVPLSGMISDDTRVSFWKAFGYLPSVQVDIEKEVDRAQYAGINTYPVSLTQSVGLYTI